MKFRRKRKPAGVVVGGVDIGPPFKHVSKKPASPETIAELGVALAGARHGAGLAETDAIRCDVCKRLARQLRVIPSAAGRPARIVCLPCGAAHTPEPKPGKLEPEEVEALGFGDAVRCDVCHGITEQPLVAIPSGNREWPWLLGCRSCAAAADQSGS